MKKTYYLENDILKEYEYFLIKLNPEQRSYIEKRLIKQIIWYDENAKSKQNKYKRYVKTCIVSSALISCVSVIKVQSDYIMINVLCSLLVSILGAISLVFGSFNSLGQYQRLWIEYRCNCEVLKSMLHKFLIKTSKLSEEESLEAFEELINLAEEYLLKECNTWTQISRSMKDNNK